MSVGSLVGALHGLDGRGTEGRICAPARRERGRAFRIESGNAEQAAIATSQTQGAIYIEKAEGQWRDGAWIDFYPVSAPVILHARTPQQ